MRLRDSTRKTQIHHQASAAFAASLVVFLFGSSPALSTTNSDAPKASDSPALMNIAPETTAISSVNEGEESLELSSRFSQDGNAYVEGVDWTVKSQSGDVIYHSLGMTVDLKVSPGAYEVIATYGTVKIDEAVNVPAQTKLAINFVLNAGALRVLPRLKGISGEQVISTAKIFRVNGPQNGRLITTSHQPGQLIKLSAGSYRIETQFADSNVVAITDIDVKSGIMRSVDVDHHAGLAHFSVLHAADNIEWLVKADQGEEIALSNPSDPMAILKPGHYLAQAKIGNQTLQQSFIVKDGQVQDVVLAN
jgi:hypothetical protein